METKTAIMKFITSMLVAFEASDDDYDDLLNLLKEQNFEDSYQEAVDILNSACDELRTDLTSPNPKSHEKYRGNDSLNLTINTDLNNDDEGEEFDDDTFDVSKVFSTNHPSIRIFDGSSHELSPLPPMYRQPTMSLMDIYKSKSVRFVNSPAGEDGSNFSETPIKSDSQPGTIVVMFPSTVNRHDGQRLVVCPREGTMVGWLSFLC